MNKFYYPPLFRQDISVYYKNNNEFYLTYNCKKNYDNIAKDCQYRCVYCDAHINECGGEPFSLDHFRPSDVFSDKFNGILSIHPFNLHLSCQKCNVLKTNDWKGCRSTIDGVTYISKLGYLDRFKVDIASYIDVDENGMVHSINSNGPGEYMILKLLLNRTNRVYLRKRRVVREKADRILKLLINKQIEIFNDSTLNKMSSDDKLKEIEKLSSLFRRFKDLNLMMI